MNKFSIIFVLMILVLPVFSISAMTTDNDLMKNMNYDGDFLDQNQTEHCGYSRYFSDKYWYAQGFTPTLNVLTRVELLWSKKGEPKDGYDIHVGIRNELRNDDLAICSVNVSEIQGLYYWIEFDFSDIVVTPGEMYYIVVRINCDAEFDSRNYYGWSFQINNPYDNGDAWSSNDYGKSWKIIVSENLPDRDFSFKTYGLSNSPPNNPICSYDKEGDVIVIVGTDPDENMIRYGVDWDDDQVVDEWTDLVSSGTDQTIECNGKKSPVGVITEDEYGFRSNWISVESKGKALSKINHYDYLFHSLFLMMKRIPFLQSFSIIWVRK